MLHLLQTESDFEHALKETEKYPDFLLTHYTIRNFVTKRFPDFELKVFASTLDSGGKLWIVARFNLANRPYMLFGIGEAKNLDYEQFVNVYDGVLKHLPNLYDKPGEILFLGVEKIFVHYRKYMNEKYSNIRIETDNCHFFYSNDEQIEHIKNLRIELPEEYEFDSVDLEKDLDTISDSWQYGTMGEKDRTRAKLTWLPYSLIREKSSKKPVSYFLIDPSGYINHQYTHLAHRGKGLGTAVERDICRKSYEMDIIPNKTISIKNKNMLESARKSPYWTQWKHDGNDVIYIFGKHFF